MKRILLFFLLVPCHMRAAETAVVVKCLLAAPLKWKVMIAGVAFAVDRMQKSLLYRTYCTVSENEKKLAALQTTQAENHRATTQQLCVLEAKAIAAKTLLDALNGKADEHTTQLFTLMQQVDLLPTEAIMRQLLNTRIGETECTFRELIETNTFTEQQRTSILVCVEGWPGARQEMRDVKVMISGLLIENGNEGCGSSRLLEN